MEGLRSRGVARIGYVGARRGLEREVIPRYRWIEFFPIHGRGLPRRLGWGLGLALVELLLGMVESLLIVLRFRPTLILGTGGYVSFFPLLWGILLQVPTIVQEENVVPGLVNRLLARWADLTLVAHAETAKHLRARRIVVTGVPLRPRLLAMADREPAELRRELGLHPEKPLILVLGGSRGAAVLNQAIVQAKEELRRDGLQVLLLSGRGVRLRAEAKAENLVVREYLDDEEIGKALVAADLVISRAGAGILAELTALGKPAILVPWPGAAEAHQERNAQFLARAGGALLLPEAELKERGLNLIALSRALMADRERLAAMAARSRALGRRDALNRVLEEIERLAAERGDGQDQG